jgi:16S rRNA (cytidine1402-2'-O)-methyltransferase
MTATLGELQSKVADGSIVSKGEFVIVVEGAKDEPGTSIEVDVLLTELAKVLPGKQAAAITAKITGLKRNTIYARMLEITRA